MHDLIIIGAGSAGLSAAIYAGRAKLDTLVIERDRAGGQIRITDSINNYPGVPNISGEKLGQTMREQAEAFGARFLSAAVESVDFSGAIKRVETTAGSFEALAVIVATGATPRSVGFKGEAEYRGRGVAVCATCDGELFSGMDLFVIGGGLAAAEEALFLTRYARKVTMIVRKSKLSVPRRVAESVLAHPRIELRFNTEIVEAGGDGLLRYAVFRSGGGAGAGDAGDVGARTSDGAGADASAGGSGAGAEASTTGAADGGGAGAGDAGDEIWRYEVPDDDQSFGIFVFAGYIPQSAQFAEALQLDDNGYIPTDESMRTNVDGVYAAGDIRPKELRQLVTAVADGAIAATNAEHYIEEARTRLGLPSPDDRSAVETDGASAAVTGANAAATKADGVFAAGAGVAGAPAANEVAATAGCPAEAAAEAEGCPAEATAPEAAGCPAEATTAAAEQNGASSSTTESAANGAATFFDAALSAELAPIVQRFERPVGICAVLDESQPLDAEIGVFVREFAALAPKVAVTFLQSGAEPAREQELGVTLLPALVLTDGDGQSLGVQFHGVPSGHEINSFVLALYNAAGPGQPLDEALVRRARALEQPLNIKIGVTLACSLCPDVVAGAQQLALVNPQVSAEMIDVTRFGGFKARWGVMSVPAVVINDERIVFGKRDLNELLGLLEDAQTAA
ncbi:MAG: FAD-dependent oxidoreductase [Coriobacteriales bacterium]|nr:FAD-dependent oxidoreductase [Coriobacteriales bacterium]